VPELRVDWAAARLLSSIRTSVILQPPDAIAPDRTPVPARPVRLPRVANFRTSYLTGAGVEGVAEVLDANVDAFVCVLGCAPAPGRTR
jgi:hypothetical protein